MIAMFGLEHPPNSFSPNSARKAVGRPLRFFVMSKSFFFRKVMRASDDLTSLKEWINEHTTLLPACNGVVVVVVVVFVFVVVMLFLFLPCCMGDCS